MYQYKRLRIEKKRGKQLKKSRPEGSQTPGACNSNRERNRKTRGVSSGGYGPGEAKGRELSFASKFFYVVSLCSFFYVCNWQLMLAVILCHVISLHDTAYLEVSIYPLFVNFAKKEKTIQLYYWAFSLWPLE